MGRGPVLCIRRCGVRLDLVDDLIVPSLKAAIGFGSAGSEWPNEAVGN